MQRGPRGLCAQQLKKSTVERGQIRAPTREARRKTAPSNARIKTPNETREEQGTGKQEQTGTGAPERDPDDRSYDRGGPRYTTGPGGRRPT
ncbi:hypothetical protein NDU88_003374 [Pleurodeles waltl]|uniref:Uncharacterized protein n=1 Tax=Pleurodeles waltl TaxID=8319 RepID=A0AAV7TR35_PLEWA|nr:hypothetical protein NDU88_003374 [Pleurodeles waltl]